MANISKNIEEVADYLEANGYLRSNNKFFDTKFIKDDKAVIIYADKVSFRNYSADGNEPEFAEYASFEGINMLNTVDWIYLFHITGIITLKSFIKNVKHGNGEAYKGLFPALVKATRKIAMLLTAVVLMLFVSCTPHSKLWQRCGKMVVDNNGVYHFKPFDDWHVYNPQKLFPDTMFQFVKSYQKPRP